MTDRRTIDQITSDELDELYDERDQLAAQLADTARDRDRWKWYRDDAERRVRIQRERAERAEQRIPQFTVRPVDPEMERAATERARHLAAEAEHVAAHLATIGAPGGLVVEPYRNDRHENVWVFRCWGTDTCDGWLSLDHSSKQSAERARDRHLAEDHPAEQPARTTPNNPTTSKEQ